MSRGCASALAGRAAFLRKQADSVLNAPFSLVSG